MWRLHRSELSATRIRAHARAVTHTHTRTQPAGLRGSEPGEKACKEARHGRNPMRGASPRGEGASPHRWDASDIRRDQRRESKPPNTRLRTHTGTDPAHRDTRAKARQPRSHTRRAHTRRRARTHTHTQSSTLQGAAGWPGIGCGGVGATWDSKSPKLRSCSHAPSTVTGGMAIKRSELAAATRVALIGIPFSTTPRTPSPAYQYHPSLQNAVAAGLASGG